MTAPRDLGVMQATGNRQCQPDPRHVGTADRIEMQIESSLGDLDSGWSGSWRWSALPASSARAAKAAICVLPAAGVPANRQRTAGVIVEIPADARAMRIAGAIPTAAEAHPDPRSRIAAAPLASRMCRRQRRIDSASTLARAVRPDVVNAGCTRRPRSSSDQPCAIAGDREIRSIAHRIEVGERGIPPDAVRDVDRARRHSLVFVKVVQICRFAESQRPGAASRHAC